MQDCLHKWRLFLSFARNDRLTIFDLRSKAHVAPPILSNGFQCSCACGRICVFALFDHLLLLPHHLQVDGQLAELHLHLYASPTTFVNIDSILYIMGTRYLGAVPPPSCIEPKSGNPPSQLYPKIALHTVFLIATALAEDVQLRVDNCMAFIVVVLYRTAITTLQGSLFLSYARHFSGLRCFYDDDKVEHRMAHVGCSCIVGSNCI
jgi:hypothetical protein